MLGANLNRPPKLNRAPRTPTLLSRSKFRIADAVVDDGDAAIVLLRPRL